MLQEYWASTVIFIGIFSQCSLREISKYNLHGHGVLSYGVLWSRQHHKISLEGTLPQENCKLRFFHYFLTLKGHCVVL